MRFKMKSKTINHNKTKAFESAFLSLLNSTGRLPAPARRRPSFCLSRSWTVPTGINAGPRLDNACSRSADDSGPTGGDWPVFRRFREVDGLLFRGERLNQGFLGPSEPILTHGHEDNSVQPYADAARTVSCRGAGSSMRTAGLTPLGECSAITNRCRFRSERYSTGDERTVGLSMTDR